MIPPRSRTLYGLIQEQAGRFPERIAVICAKRQATYRALADAAGEFQKLGNHGFGKRMLRVGGER